MNTGVHYLVKLEAGLISDTFLKRLLVTKFFVS